MKKILSSIAIIGYIVLSTAAAHASDGQITFNGKLTDTTCTIDVNGGGAFLGAVRLPTISASELPSVGATAAPTNFSIDLTLCTGSSTQVLAFFEPSSSFVSATGNLKNLITDSTGATNVELQLLDSAGTIIKVGDSSQYDGAPTLIVDNKATIRHSVQYYATGTAGAGLVESKVTFILTYP